MRQAQDILAVRTPGKGFTDLTDRVVGWVREQDIRTGLLTVFCRHTSASLIVQENADPDVLRDLETFFARLAPEEERLYRHRQEGPDDMPAHIRSALTGAHMALPVTDGRPALGTWQAIYLFEHRSAPHRRELVLHLVGE